MIDWRNAGYWRGLLATARISVAAAWIVPHLTIEVQEAADIMNPDCLICLRFDRVAKSAQRTDLMFLRDLADNAEHYTRRLLQSLLDGLVDHLADQSWTFRDQGQMVHVAPDFMLGDGEGSAMWWVPEPEALSMQPAEENRTVRMDERHTWRPGYRMITSRQYFDLIGREKSTPRKIGSAT